MPVLCFDNEDNIPTCLISWVSPNTDCLALPQRLFYSSMCDLVLHNFQLVVIPSLRYLTFFPFLIRVYLFDCLHILVVLWAQLLLFLCLNFNNILYRYYLIYHIIRAFEGKFFKRNKTHLPSMRVTKLL